MTMYRYRSGKSPIEAFQMTREAREDFASWPEWLKEAREDARTGEGSIQCLTPQARKGMLTLTMAGREILIRWDYWIIHNPDIDYTDVLSPAQFAEQFEAVPAPILAPGIYSCRVVDCVCINDTSAEGTRLDRALAWAERHGCDVRTDADGYTGVYLMLPNSTHQYQHITSGPTTLIAIDRARASYYEALSK